MRLISADYFLPGKPLSNADLAARFPLHEEWLERVTGNQSRHFAAFWPEEHVPSLAEMGAAAAKKALDKVGQPKLDFVILATATPDQLMPPTVNIILDLLGFDGVPTYQVLSGCSGAMQALSIAKALLAEKPGTGLVIGADTTRHHLDFSCDPRTLKATEIVNYALFGDGAGAVVVTSDGNLPGLDINALFLRSQGLGRSVGQHIRWCAPGRTLTGPSQKRVAPIEEDYKAIEREVPGLAKQVFAELHATTAWTPGDVDFYLPPQLNGLMVQKLCHFVGIPLEKAVNCVAWSGNNGNALPFVQLATLMPRLSPGQRVMGSAIESSKWIVSGYAGQYKDQP